MARPAKSVKTQTRHNTKADKSRREAVENALKGDGTLTPPDYLTLEQAAIFEKIKAVLSQGTDILGELDVYILSEAAITIDRLSQIDKQISTDSTLILDKDVTMIRQKYVQDFFRCCNELCLSPQARAKIGSLNLQKSKEDSDPLLTLLKGAESS